jgi:hypothetical protein
MIQVQRERCKTCIFNKDSTLNLKNLLDQVRDKHMPGYFKGHRVCHHSKTACCKGFWDAHKDDFTLGQIAQRLDRVEFVDHDTLK